MKNKNSISKILSVLPLLLWCFCLFCSEGTLHAFAVLLAITIHECGHYCAFRVLGEKHPILRFHALGITLTPRRILSYRGEATVAFFGPLFNLIFSIALIPLYSSFTFVKMTAQMSLLLAVVHLLPIIPLDGGRISLALLHSAFGEFGVRLSVIFSTVTLYASLFFFLYFLLYYGIGFAPLFSVFFLLREQESHSFDL